MGIIMFIFAYFDLVLSASPKVDAELIKKVQVFNIACDLVNNRHDAIILECLMEQHLDLVRRNNFCEFAFLEKHKHAQNKEVTDLFVSQLNKILNKRRR